MLIKALIPGLVNQVGAAALDSFLVELGIKVHRYAEAIAHPGEGGATRRNPSEPLGGPTPEGEMHLRGTRDPRRPGGRALERQWEADLWNRIRGSQ